MATGSRDWRRLGVTLLSLLLALVFLVAGGTKLAGFQMHRDQFAGWGYPIWFMYVVGLIEAGGAALLLVPRTRFYGAALLACNMAGAVFTHLKAGEVNHLPPPVVLLAFAGLVAWARRP